MMRMRSLKNNTEASAIPLILFVLGLFATGAVYTFCFIYIAPCFYDLVPNGMFKTLILGIIYFVPLVVLLVGVLSLLLSGIKKDGSWMQQGGFIQ